MDPRVYYFIGPKVKYIYRTSDVVGFILRTLLQKIYFKPISRLHQLFQGCL